MKTINFSIWAAALASLVLISCSKEQELQIGNQEDSPVEMVTLKFKAEKAGADTKTSANIDAVNNKVSYTWTDEDEDNITVYLVDGSDLTPVTAVVSKTSDTQLSIIAEVPKADSYTIRAILAREFYAKGKPMVSKYQSPANDNFDPYGDILFSDDEDIVTTGDLTDELLLTFNRKVSVNKMTLRSLGAGEKVSKVEISSDKDLVGYFDGTDLVPVADSKKIVLSYDNVTVPASGEFPVYFTCMEMAGHTLTVTVTTDAKTYTKTFGAGGINFALGKFLTFGVTMPAGVAPTSTWDLVTSSSSSLAAGDIIVIANNTPDYAISTTQNGNNRAATAVTSVAAGSRIEEDDAIQQITLEDAGSSLFYFNVGSDSYLYAASSTKNYLRSNTKTTVGDNGKWAVSISASSIATITAQGSNTRNIIAYNANNGDPIFSCYGSSSDNIKIYRKTAADNTVWNLVSLTLDNAPDKNEYSDGDSFDPTGMVVKATFEDNAGIKSNKVITVNNSELSVSPTVLLEGDTKVTLSYLNKTVDVTGLTVVNMPYSLITSADGLATGVDYYLGCSTVDKYSTGTVGLWDGTTSSNQGNTVYKTFTSSTGSFNNVTDAELVVLEAVPGESGQYYIKVKSSDGYLYNSSGTNLTVDDKNKTAWTFVDFTGSKNGIYLQSENCKVSSNGSSKRLRPYASSSYKGIVFFRKN